MTPMDILLPDEKLLLAKYRQSRALGHAAGEWAIKDAVLVKLDVVEKVDLSQLREKKA